MVFFVVGFIAKDKSTLYDGIVAVLFSVGVEVAKFYQAPWIVAFRATTVGGLLLGHGFSMENIVCYLIGIAIGCACEKLWFEKCGTKILQE